MKLAYRKIYRPRRKKKIPHLIFFAAVAIFLLSLNYTGSLNKDTGRIDLLSSIFTGDFFQKAQAADTISVLKLVDTE